MLPTRTRVAVVQLRGTPDVVAMRAQADRLIDEAAAAGADLVALPENAAFLGPEAEARALATAVDGEVIGWFREKARQHGVVMLVGSFAETGPGDGRIHNTSVLLGRDGEVLASYRKMHLFDVVTPEGHELRESDNIAPGAEPVVAELGAWTLGLTVCYDLRFPELYRRLVERGATLLTCPAAFTAETGRDHWHLLLRARAVENLACMVAPNHVGHHFGRRRSYGRSCVIDEWGTVLATCPDRPSVALATIDADRVAERRASFPCLEHRRLSAE